MNRRIPLNSVMSVLLVFRQIGDPGILRVIEDVHEGRCLYPADRYLVFHFPDQNFSLATPHWEVTREKVGCGCNIVSELLHVDLRLPNWHFCILAFM